MKLVVEGWRNIAHSYAICMRNIELAMLRRNDVKLYHVDIPYFNEKWQPNATILDDEESQRLLSIPDRPDTLQPDAVLRFTWPMRFDLDRSGCPTYVWGTTESLLLLPFMVEGQKDPTQVLPISPNQIITPSAWSARGFIAAGARTDHVHVIPAGVDTNKMRPVADPLQRTALRHDLGWSDKFVLLHIGAMTESKGYIYLLYAAAVLLHKHPNLRIVLKGSDDLYQSWEMFSRFAEKVPKDLLQRVVPHIQYLGNTLSDDEMVELYQASDLYVSPYEAEGFNLPVLEAGACGLPVICTRGGPTDDFVDDAWCRRIDSQILRKGAEGILKPNLDHLVRLIDESIEDTAWRRQAAIAGPNWVADRFTWEHVADQMTNVLRLMSN